MKFRVWDKQRKEYLKEKVFLGNEGNLYDISYTINASGQFVRLSKERFVIEFYTGLKDKNGKEIYEGDIVKFTRNLGDWTGRASLVFWEKASCSFMLRYTMCDKKLIESYEYEIIGNKWENPELLEGDK